MSGGLSTESRTTSRHKIIQVSQKFLLTNQTSKMSSLPQINDLIGYDQIIEKSMRTVIRDTIKKVEKSGLPGDHYFVITFKTKIPEVSISKELLARYPEEMTIVIQNQYKGLAASLESFKVSLSFSGKFENLTIPYNAISSFCDPSINFALKFSIDYSASDIDDDLESSKLESANSDKVEAIDVSSKVVSLDEFRKNHKPNKK